MNSPAHALAKPYRRRKFLQAETYNAGVRHHYLQFIRFRRQKLLQLLTHVRMSFLIKQLARQLSQCGRKYDGFRDQGQSIGLDSELSMRSQQSESQSRRAHRKTMKNSAQFYAPDSDAQTNEHASARRARTARTITGIPVSHRSTPRVADLHIPVLSSA